MRSQKLVARQTIGFRSCPPRLGRITKSEKSKKEENDYLTHGSDPKNDSAETPAPARPSDNVIILLWSRLRDVLLLFFFFHNARHKKLPILTSLTYYTYRALSIPKHTVILESTSILTCNSKNKCVDQIK